MQLTPFTKEDFSSLYSFMQPIWLETYGDFLPEKQIQLLLDKYFSPAGLQHFQNLGYRYFKIDNEGVLVYVEKENELYIDKLYLPPSMRGKNYPASVFAELLTHGKDLTLNVNQNNRRAVQCYLKNGFIIAEEQRIDLGNGMVNVDYFMRKKAGNV